MGPVNGLKFDETLREGKNMIRLERIDHFVMRVSDIDLTCAFYSKVLGMEVISFGGLNDGKYGVERKALKFGQQKINLHPDDSDWYRARNPRCGGEDFCLITETPMDDVVAHLEKCGVEIEVSPSERNGALGTINSVYFRDPDGNLVEISNYP